MLKALVCSVDVRGGQGRDALMILFVVRSDIVIGQKARQIWTQAAVSVGPRNIDTDASSAKVTFGMDGISRVVGFRLLQASGMVLFYIRANVKTLVTGCIDCGQSGNLRES